MGNSLHNRGGSSPKTKTSSLLLMEYNGGKLVLIKLEVTASQIIARNAQKCQFLKIDCANLFMAEFLGTWTSRVSGYHEWVIEWVQRTMSVFCYEIFIFGYGNFVKFYKKVAQFLVIWLFTCISYIKVSIIWRKATITWKNSLIQGFWFEKQDNKESKTIYHVRFHK